MESIGRKTQAYAACQYQRHGCGPNCILAPYFPPEQKEDFINNAQKLFGMAKMKQMITWAEPDLQDDTVTSFTIMKLTCAPNSLPWAAIYGIIEHLKSRIVDMRSRKNCMLPVTSLPLVETHRFVRYLFISLYHYFQT